MLVKCLHPKKLPTYLTRVLVSFQIRIEPSRLLEAYSFRREHALTPVIDSVWSSPGSWSYRSETHTENRLNLYNLI